MVLLGGKDAHRIRGQLALSQQCRDISRTCGAMRRFWSSKKEVACSGCISNKGLNALSDIRFPTLNTKFRIFLVNG
jgi:hypothetical protein